MTDTDLPSSDVPVAKNVAVRLTQTGPGWAELRLSFDDEEFAIRISTFLGPWRSEIAQLCDAVRTGDGAVICLLDEPGEVELSVSARGSDGTVLVQAHGTYPYQAKTREMAFRADAAALMAALEAGIAPQHRDSQLAEAALMQTAIRGRKLIGLGAAIVFVVGVIWLLLGA